MELKQIVSAIQGGQAHLGIELGSTRIKGVLIGPDHAPIASGAYSWENQYENGLWTYHLNEVWAGLQACYAALAADVKKKYGVPLTTVGAMGFSGMMHGFLPFDAEGKLLTPFRTWRNTVTSRAASELTKLFRFNIPQRWSIAHLYQAILNEESYVKDMAYLTTLAGYIHWQLTGQKVLGVGEASGMFPIGSGTCDYDAALVSKFDSLVADRGFPWKLRDILPKVLTAGAAGSVLTEKGASLLDPTETLLPGCPVAPPEGDAGTGMAATNSVRVRTGNVSAGTSIFSMVVLERHLEQVYEQIDMVTTPTGKPVAMVHCNNCTNEINAWADVFQGFLEALGQKAGKSAIYTAMFNAAAKGEADCGGLLLYNYLSGEPVTGFSEGRPLLTRGPEARLDFANFMRVQLYSAVATLKLGMNILEGENVKIDRLSGHGGYFKTPDVGQRVMAAALNAPVSVIETAGEGGAWGMALLAAYLEEKEPTESLEDYLENRVFRGRPVVTVEPVPDDQEGFGDFIDRYTAGLTVEQAAVESI